MRCSTQRPRSTPPRRPGDPPVKRALPGPIVDLIRDGVPPAALKAGGDLAVWRALVRTAASACQRGQTRTEWEALLGESRSRLGAQARLKKGRTERTNRDYHRVLNNAWTRAAKWLLTADPAISAEQIRERADTVTAVAADPETPLPDAYRAVLAHAANVARRNGTTRPALPRRAVAEATGLTERTARTTLGALHLDGLLRLEVAGRSSSDPRRQRAALYQLPDAAALTAYLYPKYGSMGHLAQIYGTPAVDPAGTPPQIYGTPPPLDPKETNVETLTISGTPEGIAAFIRLANTIPAVQVEQKPAKILPLRSVPAERRPAS